MAHDRYGQNMSWQRLSFQMVACCYNYRYFRWIVFFFSVWKNFSDSIKMQSKWNDRIKRTENNGTSRFWWWWYNHDSVTQHTNRFVFSKKNISAVDIDDNTKKREKNAHTCTKSFQRNVRQMANTSHGIEIAGTTFDLLKVVGWRWHWQPYTLTKRTASELNLKSHVRSPFGPLLVHLYAIDHRRHSWPNLICITIPLCI